MYAGTQLSSFGAREGDKSRACISQTLRISLSQQREWSLCLAVTSRADDDERTFSEAFRLKPGLAATASLVRRGQFGNDPFKLVIRAGLEERGGVSGKLLAEKEWVFAEDELFELGPPLQQWPVSQILTVQVQNVEGAED